jgi:hypothetical protein
MAGFQAALPAGPVTQGLNSCAAQTDSNNTKVTPPGLQAVAACTGLSLLELSHVCTFQPDRPGRTV